MFPRLIVLAALLSILPAPGRAQDSQPQTEPQPQSLGDIARQARAQKNAAAHPKTVITNDDVSSAPGPSAGAILGLDKPGASAGPASTATPSTDPVAALDNMESVMKRLDSTDRPTAVKLALQGANPNFPGHAGWEDRLMAAKQVYVSQGEELVRRGRDFLATAQALKNVGAGPDDPRVKQLNDNLKGFMQDSVRADSAFQAVILEGRYLAKQSPSH